MENDRQAPDQQQPQPANVQAVSLIDQPVWVETRGQHIPGTVLHPASTPRSYVIETPSGELRRNRTHLRYSGYSG